jgi:ParB family chromosome partitioning protein
VVTPHDDGYRLIAGERRWRAAGLAGLTTVPVVVREATARDMLAVALIENVQRANLDPMEAATAYRRLAEEFGLTHSEVAELVGKARTTVTNAVRLLALEPEIQVLVRTGALSEGHGRALLAVAAGDNRLALSKRAAREQWSVRELERVAKAPAGQGRTVEVGAAADADTQDARDPRSADPHEAAAVRALEEALGTRVELRRRGAGGSLVVHFYSDEELNTLYDRILGQSPKARR